MAIDRVIPFSRLGMHDVSRVGGKNASLGEMIRGLSGAGVRVPDGFATTADAFREFLGDGGLDHRIAGVPFTVTLSNPPTGSLVVTVASNNAGVGFSPASLTFNAGNYSTPQTVTVSGLMDDDVAGISNANLTLTASGANMATVSVTVVEDDVQSILHNAPNPLTMAENANAAFGADTDPVRFAGRPEIGELMLLGARVYDPAVGRFLSGSAVPDREPVRLHALQPDLVR